MSLENYIEKHSRKLDVDQERAEFERIRDNRLINFENEIITRVEFQGVQFELLDLKHCSFNNISSWEFTTWNCVFENCVFKNCSFNESKFLETDFINCKFIECDVAYLSCGDVSFRKTSFINCNELLGISFGNCVIDNLEFQKSCLYLCRFESIATVSKTSLTFNSCEISKAHFLNTDLTKSNFKNCRFNQIIFTACFLSEKTFKQKNSIVDNIYSNIDLQTIIQSPNLNDNTNKLFGITNSDVKDYIAELTTEVHYQSVFISYSFKDSAFARKLNQTLHSNGVATFLWEKDAPGGRRLTQIMAENIKKYDRILYIASRNSLRSTACQYELSEGRKKQEEDWKTIFFPIHIDNYLFEVRKDDIRPVKSQDEIWENIEEIKGVNSLDFTEFNKVKINTRKFNESVKKLVAELRKKYPPPPLGVVSD